MRRFQPRMIPALATLVGMAIFLRLGWWQWHKADRVEAEAQSYAARVHDHPLSLGAAPVDAQATANMPVIVRGQYEATGQFFLDNQQERGVPGVHVITPLRIEDTDTRVLVNRGWIGWGASRAALPVVAVPEGAVVVHGLAQQPRQDTSRWTAKANGPTGALTMRLDLERYRQQVPHPVQPVVVLQDPQDASDGLVRNWPAPENKAGMHRGYAVQWLLITLALVVFSVVTSFRKVEA